MLPQAISGALLRPERRTTIACGRAVSEATDAEASSVCDCPFTLSESAYALRPARLQVPSMMLTVAPESLRSANSTLTKTRSPDWKSVTEPLALPLSFTRTGLSTARAARAPASPRTTSESPIWRLTRRCYPARSPITATTARRPGKGTSACSGTIRKADASGCFFSSHGQDCDVVKGRGIPKHATVESLRRDLRIRAP
jgi:hypothetical protein